MNREEYVAYRESPHWQTMRRKALTAAGKRCQVCNAKGPLDVHHRTYERLGAERPDDLTVLCRPCHDLFHDGERKVASKPKRSRKRKKKHYTGIPAKGSLQRDMAAMKQRNTARMNVVVRPGEGIVDASSTPVDG